MYTAAEVQADLATLKSLSLRVVSIAELMEEAVNITLSFEQPTIDQLIGMG